MESDAVVRLIEKGKRVVRPESSGKQFLIFNFSFTLLKFAVDGYKVFLSKRTEYILIIYSNNILRIFYEFCLSIFCSDEKKLFYLYSI